jgi:ABC-type sugar transport system ATPase subunit/ribose/xylose/arabinose/galactoside ABC-type transport system permease subunit
VELRQIVRSFPGVQALRGADLALSPGRIHALVGANGAGKSTLIAVLGGALAPDSGTVILDGRPIHFTGVADARRAGIVVVHQEVDLFPDLSAAENIAFLQGRLTRGGILDPAAEWRRAEAAARAVGGLDLRRPADRLTPAQRQLLEIGAAVSQSARVLVLDEPTSSLSATEAAALFEHLRRFRDSGTAILYVSHRLEEVFALADEVTVLRDGQVVWGGPLAGTTPGQLVARMIGHAPVAAARSERGRAGRVRFRCADLTAADGSFAGVTLEVRAGEVLGLYGLVGAGRTEWAQGVFGLRPLAGGRVEVDDTPVTPTRPAALVRRGLAYVPEDRLRQGLCRGLSVRANAVLASLRRLARLLWLPRAAEERVARAVVARLAVKTPSVGRSVGTLSGGNQQKVVLGRWLEREPGVLILDEPTRGVDVGAKDEIYGLIRRFADEGRAVVFISSDLPEVLAQGDRIGVFRAGRLVAQFDAGTATHTQVGAAALTPVSRDAGRSAGAKPPAAQSEWLERARRLALPVVLLALAVVVQARTGRFLTTGTLTTLTTDTALLGLCALGAMLVILAGGIDISLGSLMALSAGVAGWYWEQRGWPAGAVAALAVAIGAAAGFVNAAVSLLGRVHPIVVTLGTLSVYRGVTLAWLEQDVQIRDAARGWALRPALGLPPPAWAGLFVALALGLLLRFTARGRELYAQGSNPAAARRVGVSQARTWLTAFAAQGALAGLAGFLFLAYDGVLHASAFDDKTLQAIAAAVLGGVAITGGRGSVAGVLVGALALVTLQQTGVYLGVPANWDRVLVGAVLVAAVTLDVAGRRRGGA